MINLIVVSHPLVQHKLSILRDISTDTARFRQVFKEISLLLGYEVTRDLELEYRQIQTPLAQMQAPTLSGKNLVFISVLRAGGGLLQGMLELVPSARVGHIGLYRNPETLEAIEYYLKVPVDLKDRPIIVLDPMLGTANTSIAAVNRIKKAGGRMIKMVCLLTVSEGITAFHREHPDVPLYTAAVDEYLNDHAYIVPGLGDAGDRLYRT